MHGQILLSSILSRISFMKIFKKKVYLVCFTVVILLQLYECFLGGWCSFFNKFFAFVSNMDFLGSAVFFDHDEPFVFEGVESF